jgi:biotin carboxyl carrier protein
VRSATTTLRYGEREFTIGSDDQGHILVDGEPFVVSVLLDGAVRVSGTNGSTATGWAVVSGDTRWVFLDGRVFEFEVARGGRRKRGGGHHGSLSAPMPATVRRIDVKPGDTVKRGQTLILLEAMKMELPVRASSDGTVTSVNCREGELVQPGTTLIELDDAD